MSAEESKDGPLLDRIFINVTRFFHLRGRIGVILMMNERPSDGAP